MVTKTLVACTHKGTTSFFRAFLIRWQTSSQPRSQGPLSGNEVDKFPRRFRVVFARDWLGSLIHIHSNRRELHIWILKFVVEWGRVVEGLRANFTPGGRICLIRQGPNTWKEVLILSKVSNAVGKQSLTDFVQKATRVPNCCPSGWTRALAVRFEGLWTTPHLRTGQWSGIFNSVLPLKYLKDSQFEWYCGKS